MTSDLQDIPPDHRPFGPADREAKIAAALAHLCTCYDDHMFAVRSGQSMEEVARQAERYRMAESEALALMREPAPDGKALRELRAWVEANVDPADGQVAILAEIDRLTSGEQAAVKPAAEPVPASEGDPKDSAFQKGRQPQGGLVEAVRHLRRTFNNIRDTWNEELGKDPFGFPDVDTAIHVFEEVFDASIASPQRQQPAGDTSPVCRVCNDTHRMELEDATVMCTHCPTPCKECRVGAYCRTTPCSCQCHGKHPLTPAQQQALTAAIPPLPIDERRVRETVAAAGDEVLLRWQRLSGERTPTEWLAAMSVVVDELCRRAIKEKP